MTGEYGIALVKNGIKLGTAGAKLTRIEASRVLDGIGYAKVDLVTAGSQCCGQLGAVDHWNTDLIITAVNPDNGRDDVLWRGPVKKPTYRRGSVTIEANDVLTWLQVRLIEQDFTFPSQDISDTAIALIEYAMQKGGPESTPVFSIIRYDSDTQEARVVEASSNRMTWNVLTEMLEAGLDVTVFGSRIIVGKLPSTPLALKDTDVLGSTETSKDGDSFLNRSLAGATSSIMGIYPPGAPAGSNGYPLVEAINTDSQLPDQASADTAAKARYDFAAEGVRRVNASGGLQLLPSSGINPRTLLPGQLINFTASETCYAVTETLRVGKVQLVVEKGSETATIDLQPFGEDAATSSP